MVVVPPPARRLVGDDTECWTPWTNDRWESLGHLHLFRIAQSLARGGRVLVLGSGEGFGAAMLAEVADHVFAIEPDVELLLHSRYNYRRPNLVISHGEPHQVLRHTEEGSFDLVTTLDFNSPVSVAEQVIDWAPKLLRPEGALLLSIRSDAGRTLDEAAATGGTHGNGIAWKPRFGDRVVTSAQIEGLLHDRFPEVARWRQSVGSRFARAAELEALEGGRELLAKEKDVFVASFVATASLLRPPATANSDEAERESDILDWVDPIGDRETAAADLLGVPPASVELGEALALDETRLRRQVVAYDAAIGRAFADARDARRETEGALAELEIAEIELWAAKRDLESRRKDAERVAAELEQARAEADMLRRRLEDIEGSRSYRTVRKVASMRPSFPTR